MRIGLHHSENGILLAELLVYMALSVVVFTVGGHAFFRSLSNMRDLERNTDNIVEGLKAGELWRADVRGAGQFQFVTNQAGAPALCLGVENPICWYAFNGSVWRQQDTSPPREVLKFVKGSAMTKDQRSQVTALRWELEFATRKAQIRVRPLFEFHAVPGLHAR
jgi:hypothetical protein